MVFYRKYRPQTIDELDNAQVRETLNSVLSSENVPHAFLFTGPKGLGKTSTARIIAKIVNCTGKGKKPCNKCDSCVSITNGSNMDILEIDAASNRGIDEIRDLREKIKLSPFSAKKKVYIIDEVHMLTTEAFNALLKTLEEPPAHAIFILCTTEPHKVPATIASRCFHISFTKATDEELVRSFERIAKGEKINVDKDALLQIAKLSEGSFRDGTKLLEEMVAIANGKKITKELIEQKHKVSGIVNLVFRMLEALEKKDAKAGLEVVQQLAEQGVDIRYFLQQVLGNLHEVLLVKIGIKETGTQNQGLKIEEIKILFELLSKAYQEVKYAVLPQLPLELAIIEYCSDQRGPVMGFPPANALAGGKSPRSLEDKVPKLGIGSGAYVKHQQALKNLRGQVAEPVKADEKPQGRQTDIDQRLGGKDKFFSEFITEVNNVNRSVAGVLRGCKIETFGDGKLVLTTAFKFHKERLEEDKSLKILEDVAKAITGKDVRIGVQLIER
ncbi:MAG TPA: DNA polymerase III subunit gamma/tau [Candidatus Saccharimonadales bacterium]|nr:DNA polymerase III subunit gamma/tau [Candidatus Saccharimonadales bacterium]